MPAYKVMANVKVSMNLDFVVNAENEEEAKDKLRKMIHDDRFNPSLDVGKNSYKTFTPEESDIYNSMEMDEDGQEIEVEDAELAEDEE